MRLWMLAAVIVCAAAGPVAEPQDYWTGPVQGPVPQTIKSGTVIHTAALAELSRRPGVVLIDVANAPHHPANLPQTSLWMPSPHQDIPGSLWLPGFGEGRLPADMELAFRKDLAAVTGSDLNRPVVVYCHRMCWLSWNAAKRAISYGYRRVFWYPDGVEGWIGAGMPLRPVKQAG